MTLATSWADQERPYIQRRCVECGAAFVARTDGNVYCSPRCKGRVNARQHYRRARALVATKETPQCS